MPLPRMSEAEVSLRLAAYLIASGRATTSVSVAIDGAQARVKEKEHFNVPAFMSELGWLAELASARWQGAYTHPGAEDQILVHSRPGLGDVTTTLDSGQTFVAEAKKGPLARAKSSAEYSLLREALGHVLTIENVPENAFLAVAVPAGERFLELAERWRQAPLVHRAGIHILTVAHSGEVSGWPG